MSGIFRRNRTETGLEFWNTAVEIKREVTRFLMNPNNVPKSYRFVFTFRIIGLTFDLRDAITRANTTFPVNEHELQRRKDFQQDAINTNEAINYENASETQEIPAFPRRRRYDDGGHHLRL